MDGHAAALMKRHSFHLSLPSWELLGVQEPGLAPHTSLSSRAPCGHSRSAPSIQSPALKEPGASDEVLQMTVDTEVLRPTWGHQSPQQVHHVVLWTEAGVRLTTTSLGLPFAGKT